MKRLIRSGLVGLAASAAWPAMAVAQVAGSGDPPPTSTPGPPATTQEQTVGESNAVDIIITARKQNETLLKTPATVTVLTSDALETKNITNANQLSGIVPGLVMTPAVGGLPGTTFRGLGSNSSVFGVESSVAQFQDGVYLGHLRDYVTPLYDIDHIEFIKGTQSTLLGKNTSLGAISVVNRRPTREFGYDARIGYSFEIDRRLGEAAVNLPVGETVAVRAAGFYSDEDGYYRNQYTGKKEATLRDLSGRISIAYRAAGGADAVLIYQHDDRRSHGQAIELLSDPTNVLRNRAAASGQTGLNVVPDGINGSASAPIGGTVAGPETRDEQVTNRLNLIVNVPVGEHTLTSQTAYVRYVARYTSDVDLIAANLFTLNDVQRNRIFSQELRLSSPSANSLTYLAGVFYYKNTWELDRLYAGSPANTIGFPLTGSTFGSFDQPTETFSAFASANYRIIPKLRLSAGLRYTWEKKRGDFVRSGTGTLRGPFPDVPYTVYDSQTTKPLDYDVGLEFEPGSDTLVYLTHARGTKSGGFQEFPTTAAGGPFTGERAYSTELGGKLRIDGGGYLTAALFNTVVRGFQTNFTSVIGTPPAPQTIVGNSNVRSRGFEGAFGYPLGDLRLSGSVVYADAKFTNRFPATGPAIGNDGDRLTRAPKWTGKVAADYDRPVSDALELFAGASLDFSSSFLHQFVTPRPDAPRATAYQQFDARLGLRDKGAGWELALIGNNLTNDRYIAFATPVTAGGAGIGNQAFYGTFSRPRIISLQLSIKR